MEAVTQTNPQTKPSKPSPFDDLRSFADNPAAPQGEPIEPGAPATNVSEADILNANKHTTLAPADTLGVSGQPGMGAGGSSNGSTGARNPISMSGKFVVSIMDILLPALAVWIAHRSGYSMKKAELRLNNDDKAMLIPAFDEYLATVAWRFDNPLGQLAFTIAIVYGAKFMENPPKVEKTVAVATDSVSDTVVNMKDITPAQFEDLFLVEKANLIERTQKTKKCSRDKALTYLTNTKAYDKLRSELKLKVTVK